MGSACVHRVVTDGLRRRPPAWAISLGLIAVVMVPVLAFAGMASGDSAEDSAACKSAAADEQALLTKHLLEVLPAGSVRDVSKDSDYDEACEYGGTEVSARWDQASGKAMVTALEAAGWQRKAGDEPDWYATDARPTGAGEHTNDNDSPNLVMMRTVEGKTLDLAVDQEGLYGLIARGPVS